MKLETEEAKNPVPEGCFLPLNALSVHPRGFIHFCLSSMLAPERSLAALEPQRHAIHKEFADGRWPESCGPCKRKERQKIQSRRVYTWKRKRKLYGRDLAAMSGRMESAIRHVDISFSNTCNLACAMCSSEFSSSWIKYDQQALEEGLYFREFVRGFHTPAKIQPELVADILARADDIDLILIKGGEPTKERLCLDFLRELAKREKKPTVFVQSNGTTDPDLWLRGLDGLSLGLGISMDGWGQAYEWVRGARFDTVIENLRRLNHHPNVEHVTIDFTLSAFNVLHLPDFLKNVSRLRQEVPKLKECAVTQWAQEVYASPLALPAARRLEIAERVQPIFLENPDFFLDHAVLLEVLRRPALRAAEALTTWRWYGFLNKIRKCGLGDTAEELERLLSLASNQEPDANSDDGGVRPNLEKALY